MPVYVLNSLGLKQQGQHALRNVDPPRSRRPIKKLVTAFAVITKSGTCVIPNNRHISSGLLMSSATLVFVSVLVQLIPLTSGPSLACNAPGISSPVVGTPC